MFVHCNVCYAWCVGVFVGGDCSAFISVRYLGLGVNRVNNKAILHSCLNGKFSFCQCNYI